MYYSKYELIFKTTILIIFVYILGLYAVWHNSTSLSFKIFFTIIIILNIINCIDSLICEIKRNEEIIKRIKSLEDKDNV